jgi:hypothetical protein
MKTEKMNIPLTEELRRAIIAGKIENLKIDYQLKHKQLDQQLNKEIEKLSHSLDSIDSISVDINDLPKPKRGWIETEISELKELYGKHKLTDIAKKMNKNYQSVMNKVKELGLKEPKKAK